MKSNSKLLILVLSMILAFALLVAPAMANIEAIPSNANTNAIGISIGYDTSTTYYYGDIIEYTVAVYVPAAIPGISYYPAQQTNISTTLYLPDGTEVDLPVINELNPGEAHVFDPEGYTIDPGDVVNELVEAEAECEGTAMLVPRRSSHADVDIATPVVYEELSVEKTVETSYNRTHLWDIDKWVDTEFGHTIGEEEYPKIWLYESGSGDETATWNICVTYDGYEDDDYNVSGTITIENTGTAPAVITDVEDLLGEEDISDHIVWNWPEGSVFPYTLPVGETLVGTYDEEDYFEGLNKVTVITERDQYFGDEEIVWGEPDEEYYDVVNIEDVSDEFGTEHLGTLDAADFNEGEYQCFDYYYFFAWADYDDPDPASWEINNTATILETEQSASALLKINWLEENLLVEKTAETSYTRTHMWDIEKEVTTEYGHFWNNTDIPKIWLYEDGSGDETATWDVCVTYLGYEDSGFNVSGEITIINTGTSAALITGIVDELCGNEIDIVWPDDTEFPYTLEPGDTLVGTYSVEVDEMSEECINEVTVTTEVDEYTADSGVNWGDPDEELYKVVNVEDVSDLFDTVPLGQLDADDYTVGEGECFDYSKFFAWEDYSAAGPYFYDNTATIIETGQSADASLVVNWEREELCYGDETAWAYSDEYSNENWDYVNNRFWGWNNGPLAEGSHVFDLYAGAGQNILENGILVGKVYVDYEDGCVNVTYETFESENYYLGEVHLWVGDDVLPYVTRGRSHIKTYTNAPGQFPYGEYIGFEAGNTMETEWEWSKCSFEGDIYVAAHAVVWMPVECAQE